jgi:hypothetical protein
VTDEELERIRKWITAGWSYRGMDEHLLAEVDRLRREVDRLSTALGNPSAVTVQPRMAAPSTSDAHAAHVPPPATQSGAAGLRAPAVGCSCGGGQLAVRPDGTSLTSHKPGCPLAPIVISTLRQPRR